MYLPPELRLMIYEYALDMEDMRQQRLFLTPIELRHILQPAYSLAFACKTFALEVLPMLLQQVRFGFFQDIYYEHQDRPDEPPHRRALDAPKLMFSNAFRLFVQPARGLLIGLPIENLRKLSLTLLVHTAPPIAFPPSLLERVWDQEPLRLRFELVPGGCNTMYWPSLYRSTTSVIHKTMIPNSTRELINATTAGILSANMGTVWSGHVLAAIGKKLLREHIRLQLWFDPFVWCGTSEEHTVDCEQDRRHPRHVTVVHVQYRQRPSATELEVHTHYDLAHWRGTALENFELVVQK
ncbi:hypothetical protein NA57DRAFT_79718 [Rhizodiscina lignyota]|uniref:Uncharacterized protein n=1 Tax=Rhizodiscina lignyota TaxID=1504668 RepID=A0A9P4M6W1_9PEZI|nr:hypothetical protein NA57DRAFT_79718 [Rhizodiscina lignyota]